MASDVLESLLEGRAAQGTHSDCTGKSAALFFNLVAAGQPSCRVATNRELLHPPSLSSRVEKSGP